MTTMPTDPIAAAKLEAVRGICKHEGHNWLEVTRYGDGLRNDMCSRGCGARRHRPHYAQTLTPAELAAVMPADGRVTVTDIEIIVEPDQP